MIRVPMDVFAYTNEPAAMARGNKLVYANNAAMELLGKDCVGMSLAKLFGEDIANAQASNFVADIMIKGVPCTMRVSRQEDGRLFFFGRQELRHRLLNEALIYSVRNSLMTLSLAVDICRTKAEAQGNSEILESLRDMTRSQMRMARIMSNLSLLQDAVSDGATAALSYMDLGLMCRECADCVGAMRPDVKFVVAAEKEFFIDADPKLVKQLLTNLISNCLLHARGLSKVKLSIMDSSETVILSVSDDGCGIEAEKLHRCFERYCYPFGISELNNGVGIGLSVVRLISQKHGGTMMIESRAGQGTSVRVSFRKTRPGSVRLCSGEAEHFDIKTALLELSDCLDTEYYGEKYMD